MRYCRLAIDLGTLSITLLAGGGGRASAQDLALQGRTPRFMFVERPEADPRPSDARNTRALRGRISLDLDSATLADAPRAITQQTGLTFVYSGDVVPADSRVRLRAQDITVAAALTEILLDTGVDVLVSPTGQMALVRKGMDLAQGGTVTGRVTDARTSQGIATALVTITGTRLTALTGDSGQYRITAVPPGTYTVTARRIGYAPGTQSVAVAADAEATVNFALAAAASQLDAVVVTVTGEHRLAELGNVVGRVNADSLMQSAPIKNFDDLLTARVPGVDVRQASGFTGQATNIRIRGINSLTVRSEPILIVDGVRVDNQPGDNALNTDGSHTQGYNAIFYSYGQWSGALTNLTPDEIESVEVVKRASAATLYGTDAANGVIVIRTKHGRVGKPVTIFFTV